MAVLRNVLTNENGEVIHVEDNDPGHIITGSERTLAVTTLPQSHGVFKAVSRTSAGTTTITTPETNGSVQVTDIVLSADKVNGASVELRFTDGTNTETLFIVNVTDAPAILAINALARLRGWRDARVDLVTVGNVNAYVTTGYIKHIDALDYSEWDEKR